MLDAHNFKHGALITFATEALMERKRPASEWARLRHDSIPST